MKKLKQYTPYIVTAVVVIMMVVALLSIKPDPLDQFVTHRTCDFVEWGDFHAFACVDGFTGRFSPLAP